jgi:hypothetical protein
MFMRYRGGGVGHLYMRAIEVWLAETGWGSNDGLIPAGRDDELEESGDSASESSSEERRRGGNSEDEVSEGDEESTHTADSDGESGSDIDPDIEYASSENDEETMDGEWGFSSL